MIGFFPEIYEDELLYSQLCRYFQRTGYTRYVYAADDLYMRRTAHPVIEWVNEYSQDAMEHITKNKGFETIIREHTMFPAYTRFLPKERRNAALQSLLICDGNYYNLVVNQKINHKRFLRYCPVCTAEDRERYGETYWHREHQIVHLEFCPKHRCRLVDSAVPIRSKTTPGLFPAETEVPFGEEPELCENEKLVEFGRYVLEVFREPVDMESDVPIGSFLQSGLDGRYVSGSGIKTHSTRLYEDYCEFFRDICEPMSFDMFRKVYNNHTFDHFLIYQLAYFQRIPAKELAKRPVTLVSTAMEELYRELGEQYGIDYKTVCAIGDTVVSKYRALGRVSRKSGPKQRAWAELDEKYLPRVREIVDRIYSADGKPGRVSVTRVEREIGAPPKQFQKLLRCTEYIQNHMETTNEYRARRVTWAVRLFKQEDRYLSRNKLNHFLNFRKNDLQACCSYLADPEVKALVEDLLTEGPAGISAAYRQKPKMQTRS